MINQAVLLPTTSKSRPFCSAISRCDLSSHGYREEEYLLSGTSNRYITGENGLPQETGEVLSYTTRMIIRQPEKVQKSHVVIEIINSTAGFDIERVWADSWRYFVRHGITYVGITSKPNVFSALQRYDFSRYQALSWPRLDPENGPADSFWGPLDQEFGAAWDIFLEAPDYLRSAESPLHIKPGCIFLAGWSQSCSYINRLLNSFIYPGKSIREKVYNGYFAAGGVHKLSIPLCMAERKKELPAAERRVDFCPVPLVEINTESENSDFGGFQGYTARRADSDVPGFLYRYLEIPGSCHDAADSARDYTRFDTDVEQALGHPLTGFDLVPHPNRYPKRFGFHLAWRNLIAWASTGISPMHQPRIEKDGLGNNRTDFAGNAVGGLRTPLLELPTARYCSWNDHLPGGRNYLMGHEEPFSPAWLLETYGSLDAYMKRAAESTDLCIARGMLLEEDRQDMLDTAAAFAKTNGLE